MLHRSPVTFSCFSQSFEIGQGAMEMGKARPAALQMGCCVRTCTAWAFLLSLRKQEHFLPCPCSVLYRGIVEVSFFPESVGF
jgi:hypothetical protein